jgi:hypothetical protein
LERGYIKLWRKSLDSQWLSNHILWCFWCWCLLKATHKPIEIVVGYQKVQLEPGQLIFGRNQAAKEIAASPQNIRTCVDTLRKLGNLTIKSTNKFSIITIINWECYQSTEVEINQQTNKQLTSNQPATNHKQEHKNIRNTIKDMEFSERRRRLPDNFELTDIMVEFAKKNGINGNIENLFARFCDYHRGKGSVMLDWIATWRTWVRNEIKFNAKSYPAQKQTVIKYNDPNDPEEQAKYGFR